MASFILVIFCSIEGAAATFALEGPPRGSNGAADIENDLGELITEVGDDPALEPLLEPLEEAGLGSVKEESIDGGGYRETGRDWGFGVGVD